MEAATKVFLSSKAVFKSPSHSFQFLSGYYMNISLSASLASNLYFILGAKQSLELSYWGLGCAQQTPQPKIQSSSESWRVLLSEGSKWCELITASWITWMIHTEKFCFASGGKKNQHKTAANPVNILLLPHSRPILTIFKRNLCPASYTHFWWNLEHEWERNGIQPHNEHNKLNM